MTVTKILARNFTLEINTGTDVSPVWTPIKGLNSLSHSPSTNTTDTTDFDSAGHLEHLVASRGDEFKADGAYLEDKTTGDRDPGQEAVEELGLEMGVDSTKTFRLTSPGGNVRSFDASAEVTVAGGGNDDKAGWSAKLTVSGPVTKSTV